MLRKPRPLASRSQRRGGKLLDRKAVEVIARPIELLEDCTAHCTLKALADVACTGGDLLPGQVEQVCHRCTWIVSSFSLVENSFGRLNDILVGGLHS